MAHIMQFLFRDERSTEFVLASLFIFLPIIPFIFVRDLDKRCPRLTMALGIVGLIGLAIACISIRSSPFF